MLGRRHRRGALEHGHAGLLRQFAGGELVAHLADVAGLGADGGDVGRRARLSEPSRLREEAVTRVEGIRAARLGGGDEGRDAEVAAVRRAGADTDRLISQLRGHAVEVRFGGSQHRGDAQLLTCADDPDGDLSAVGHEHPGDGAGGGHDPSGATSTRMSSSPNSTSSPSRALMWLMTPAAPAGTGAKVFITSMRPTVVSGVTVDPTVTKGSAPGSACA